MKIQFIYIALSLIVCSCSSKLDRSRAEDMIIDHYQYPNRELAKIPRSLLMRDVYSALHKDVKDSLLVEHVRGNTSAVFGLWSAYIDFSFTPKGKQYLDTAEEHKVLLCQRDFKEITGIKFNAEETSAKVEYTIFKTGITPFGENRKYTEGQEKQYSVKMSLYDDGWRID